MARFWVGPWVWDTATGPMPHYRAPTDTIRLLDLRSDAQCGTPNSTNGNGLFVMPDAAAPGADYVEVPENFTLSSRNAVRTKLDLPQVIIAPGRVGFVLELLTRHATVDGSTFCRPLMPNRRGRLRLFLDGVDEDVVLDTASAFWAKVQLCLHATYRRYRDEAIAGTMPEDFHRRYLSVLLEKFAGRIADYHEFIPADLPDETPLPHSTTLTESFNRSDAVNLGPDQTWSTDEGTAWTRSNEASLHDAGAGSGLGGPTGTNYHVTATLAGDDHSCQISITNAFSAVMAAGPEVRYAAAALTYYDADFRNVGGTTSVQTRKRVTGTLTDLGTNPTVTQSAPDTLSLEVNGSTLTTKWNGTNTESPITDTSITANTRCGIGGYCSAGLATPRCDSWQAADLSAAFVAFPHPRGVTGGMHNLSGGLQ